MRLKYKSNISDMLARHRDLLFDADESIGVYSSAFSHIEKSSHHLSKSEVELVYSVLRYFFNRGYNFDTSYLLRLSLDELDKDSKLKAIQLLRRNCKIKAGDIASMIDVTRSTKGMSEKQKHSFTIHRDIYKSYMSHLSALSYYKDLVESDKL